MIHNQSNQPISQQANQRTHSAFQMIRNQPTNKLANQQTNQRTSQPNNERTQPWKDDLSERPVRHLRGYINMLLGYCYGSLHLQMFRRSHAAYMTTLTSVCMPHRANSVSNLHASCWAICLRVFDITSTDIQWHTTGKVGDKL